MKPKRVILSLDSNICNALLPEWHIPSKVDTSAKLGSILELQLQHKHICILSNTGQYLIVLEHCLRLKEGARSSGSNTKFTNTNGQKLSSCTDTIVWFLDTKLGRSHKLDTIPELCSEATYHPYQPIIALLLPPSTLHFYHLDEHRCTEVVHYRGVIGDIQGLHWTSISQKEQETSPTLLCYTNEEIILLCEPQPAQRLLVKDIIWAGVVHDTVCVVVGGGVVELWAPGGERRARVVPPVTLAVTYVDTIHDTIVMAGDSSAQILLCHVSKLHTEAMICPASGISAVAASASSHPQHNEVCFALDHTPALHVLCLNTKKHLKMVQSPKLPIMSVTTGGVWVCLTYANNSSKLYPLSSLLPKPEHTTDPQLNLQLQQSTRLPQYDLCNDVASSMATAWHPTEIIHFPEVTLTDNKSAASHYTTDESSTNVNVKETKNVRFINNDKTDSRKNRKLNAAKIEAVTSLRAKWQLLLATFGELPSSQRCAVWCGLLRLPRSAATFAGLARKQTHSAVLSYSSMADDALRRTFVSMLSCLYHWAPALHTVPWVPSFVFPFVKVLKDSPLACFEICVSLLMSWCRGWYCKGPESAAVAAVDTVVGAAFPRLLARLVGLRVTAGGTYAWPHMTSALAQLLSPADWLVAWDHLFSQPPSFLIYVVAAVTLCLQPTIMAAAGARQIQLVYDQETYVPIKSILKRARQLQEEVPLDATLLEILDSVASFPKGGLPVFDYSTDSENTSILNISTKGGIPASNWMTEQDIINSRDELLRRENKFMGTVKAIRRRRV